MRIHAASEADRERYDAFVASSEQADLLQSWAWGEVKRTGGWKPLRLLALDDDDAIAGACSVLLRRAPVRGIPPIAYAPRGPVLREGAEDAAAAAIAAAVRGRSRTAFLFTCDPAVEPGSSGAVALERAGFRAADAGGFGGVQPKAVMLLDVTRPEDEIFAGFKSKWRYNVRLAERKGVAVRDGKRDDLDVFYAILSETARRDKFLVRGPAYFETLWDHLEPGGMLKLFLAEFEGRPIAGIILFVMGRRATYVYGASSNEHRNVMPNHLVQWHAIRWAKDRGCEIYDFRGVSPVRDGRPLEPHLAGLNRFKEGFGARYVEYAGQLDLPLRPLWYAAWRHGGPPAIALLKRLRREAAAGVAD